MTDTTDDAVTLEKTDNPHSWMVMIGNKPIGMIEKIENTLYRAIGMNGELVTVGASWECERRLREQSERQHTLVPCATCGTGYPPKHMVSVGDDWLCPQCAGAEIGRLRQCVEHVELWTHDCYAGDSPDDLWPTGIYGFEDIESMCRAALGKEQP